MIEQKIERLIEEFSWTPGMSTIPVMTASLHQQYPKLKLRRVRSQQKLDQFKKDHSKWYNNYQTYDNALPAIIRGGLTGSIVGSPLLFMNDNPEMVAKIIATTGALSGLLTAKNGSSLSEKVKEKQKKLTQKAEFKKDITKQLEKF